MRVVAPAARWALSIVLVVQVGTAYAQRSRPRNRRGRADDSPKVGEPAPDFDLLKLSALTEKPAGAAGADQAKPGDAGAASPGKKKVRLSDFRGKQPVVLVFSSYT